MHWEERLLALFDDLEQQAEGLALSARDAEMAELGRAEYAKVALADRLHGSVGHRLRLAVLGLGGLEAQLLRVGSDWCLVEDGQHEWLVRIDTLARVRGLGQRAVDPAHRQLAARLGFGSALRGVAEDRLPVLVHLRDGERLRGALGRVGADFVELHADDDPVVSASTGRTELVAFAAVAAVRHA